MITVVVTEPAEKFLSKMDKKTQKKIKNIINNFRKDPESVNLEKIRSRKNEWKIRVGVWRIFIELDKKTKVYFINEIKRRRENTYD